MNARRQALMTIHKSDSTHAGLWLDRFLKEQEVRDDASSSSGARATAQQTLLEEATGISTPDIYNRAFARWEQWTCDAPHVSAKKASVQGRMAVGLGGASVWENTIRLHHTYGVPYIPGSALKGTAASYALNFLTDEWQPAHQSRAFNTLFGTPEQGGSVTFFDAWYVPKRGDQGSPLHPDVMTVHHPGYYQGKAEPPADWDSPNPIQFISATGDYLLALGGPYVWVQATFDILALALEEIGVGAKTSSGYGRLSLA